MNNKIKIVGIIAFFLLTALGVRVLVLHQRNAEAIEAYRQKIQAVQSDFLETEKRVLTAPDSEAALDVLDKLEHDLKPFLEGEDSVFKTEAEWVLKEIEEKRKRIKATKNELEGLEYQTVYEKEDFQIKEAFLGEDFQPCDIFYQEEKKTCDQYGKIIEGVHSAAFRISEN